VSIGPGVKIMAGVRVRDAIILGDVEIGVTEVLCSAMYDVLLTTFWYCVHDILGWSRTRPAC